MNPSSTVSTNTKYKNKFAQFLIDNKSYLTSKRKRVDLITALLFLFPSLAIFGVFTYYALGFNVFLSFTSWNFLSKTKNSHRIDKLYQDVFR